MTTVADLARSMTISTRTMTKRWRQVYCVCVCAYACVLCYVCSVCSCKLLCALLIRCDVFVLVCPSVACYVKPPMSHHEHVGHTMDTTHTAVESAVVRQAVSRDFKIAQSEPQSVINLDFLRSGGEFAALRRMASPPLPVVHAVQLDSYCARTAAATADAIAQGVVPSPPR